MADTAPPDWRPFRIRLAFTDAELDAYARLTAAARRRGAGQGGTWLALGGSVVVGFAGVAVAIAVGAASSETAGILGVIVCGAVWAGLLLPWLLWARPVGGRYRDAFRARWAGAEFRAGPGGIALRLPSQHTVYARAAVAAVTLERGLMLFWVSPTQPLAVPLRLLHADQIDRLLTFQQRPGKLPPSS